MVVHAATWMSLEAPVDRRGSVRVRTEGRQLRRGVFGSQRATPRVRTLMAAASLTLRCATLGRPEGLHYVRKLSS